MTWSRYDRPLGAPKAQAVLGEDGILRREFASGTVALFDPKAQTGQVKWGQVTQRLQ
jgi:hypothetical protein|eukprot:COSAG01_NODE_7879_length_3011_cov_3.161058_3_plen_57_part_00